MKMKLRTFAITLATLAVAAAIAWVVRSLYIGKLATMFTVDGGVWPILVAVAALALLLTVAYNMIILRSVRRTVEA